MRLEGKVAIVTGASSRGIGRAIAIHFAREGAKVAIVGRRRSGLEETSRQIEATAGEALMVEADVSIPESAFQIVIKLNQTLNIARKQSNAAHWE